MRKRYCTINQNKNCGFSIFELIFIITILSVSAATLLPQCLKYFDKSCETVCLFNRTQLMHSYEIARAEYAMENEELSLEDFLANSSDLADIDLDKTCPSGGNISISKDGKSLVCSCHGKYKTPSIIEDSDFSPNPKNSTKAFYVTNKASFSKFSA